MGKAQDACQVTNTKDPCWFENKLSMSCLDSNNYDKKLCQQEFENYKRCKGFWNSVAWARRRKGLYPLIPENEEERKAFKSQYKVTGEIPTEIL